MNEEKFIQVELDDEEIEQLEFEERMVNIISTLIVVGFAAIMLFGVISEIF